MDKAIPVFVPDAQAKQFMVFMEHYDVFDAMQRADALTVEWGKVVLNFGRGELVSLSVERVHRPGGA